MPRRNEYLVGAVTGVIGTVLGGIVLYLLTEYIQPKPHISWFEIANYDLDPRYRFGASTFEEEKELLDSKFVGLGSGRQKIVVVDNAGGAAARGLSIILQDEPLSFSIQPDVIYSTRVQENGRYVVDISSVEASSQIMMFLSGSAFGEINVSRVEFDGSLVPRTASYRFLPYNNELMISRGLVNSGVILSLLFVSIFGLRFLKRRVSSAARLNHTQKNAAEFGPENASVKSQGDRKA